MRVLITGGSGMVARKVAEELKENGHTSFALSRRPVRDPLFAGSYLWDPEQNTFDPKAFEGMDAIVHLAGAGIADKKWTAARKNEIIESRTRSTEFLIHQLRNIPNSIKTIVAASASGYYGDAGDELLHEDHPAGKGFLAETCLKWEASLQGLALPGVRLSILRIGFVIDRSGGALPVMSRPVRFFAGAPYGSGKQFISWIDSTDLSRMFLHALVSTSMQGVFNAVAPSPVNNREFIRAIGKQLHRPVWPIGVPAPVFKLLLGEQSDLVLDGQRASAEKVLAAGFKFKFDSLQASLKHHLA